MNIKNAIFIADLHICETNTPYYKNILSFLNSLKNHVEHIFFLGDIFEFWYGDTKALLKKYSDLLSILKNLSDSGTKLHFFEGNHDIYYGNYFTHTLKARVYSKSIELDINNKRIFIGHGDDLLINDKGYKFLRYFLRSKPIKLLFTLAPSSWVLNIALKISSFSRHHRRDNAYNFKLNEYYKIFAKEISQKNKLDLVILGHSHIPTEYIFENGKYLNPGTWLVESTYIKFIDDKFQLLKN